MFSLALSGTWSQTAVSIGFNLSIKLRGAIEVHALQSFKPCLFVVPHCSSYMINHDYHDSKRCLSGITAMNLVSRRTTLSLQLAWLTAGVRCPLQEASGASTEQVA